MIEIRAGTNVIRRYTTVYGSFDRYLRDIRRDWPCVQCPIIIECFVWLSLSVLDIFRSSHLGVGPADSKELKLSTKHNLEVFYLFNFPQRPLFISYFIFLGVFIGLSSHGYCTIHGFVLKLGTNHP